MSKDLWIGTQAIIFIDQFEHETSLLRDVLLSQNPGAAWRLEETLCSTCSVKPVLRVCPCHPCWCLPKVSTNISFLEESQGLIDTMSALYE